MESLFCKYRLDVIIICVKEFVTISKHFIDKCKSYKNLREICNGKTLFWSQQLAPFWLLRKWKTKNESYRIPCYHTCMVIHNSLDKGCLCKINFKT